MTSPPSGITLAEALERGAFHPLRAVHAGRDVAAILAEQHARGVVHRYVGPEDVLLGDDGVVHLSHSEEPGEPADDVRDLGRTLEQAIAQPTEHEVPPGLRVLISAMTDPDPAARPSAAEVRDRLAAMRLASEGSVAPARAVVSLPPREQQPAGRGRPVVLGLLALALVVLAIGLIAYVLRDDEADPGGAAPAPATTTVPGGAAVGDRGPDPPTGTPSAGAPAPSAPSDTADLVARINPPPTPHRQLSDEANSLGALTAEQLVALSGGTDAEQAAIVKALEDLGFQAAHARAWSRSAGSTYSVVVYRFATEAGAKDLLTRLGRERRGTAFTSRTVADAVCYSGRDGELFAQAGSLVRGTYFYDVTLATPQEEPGHEVFDQLLGAQRDRAERST